MAIRTVRAALAGICAATLTGCTVMADGVAVRAPTGPDDAIVALMDTGSYPTTASSPPGTAGSADAAVPEAHRMAEFVLGPWQADATAAQPEILATAPLENFGSLTTTLGYPLGPYSWSDPFADIGKTHEFIAGFNTGRVGDGLAKRLQNAVMHFPDDGQAAAAAREMAAISAPNQLEKTPVSDPEPIDSPWRLDACAGSTSDPVHPDFAESVAVGDRLLLRTLTAHRSYVLYQFLITTSGAATACDLIVQALAEQIRLIDHFAPTEPAKLTELPLDPSGHLRASTLDARDTNVPYSFGVWQPNAWLHFEDNPVAAGALFAAAGVEWVSQRLARVYQARDGAGAARITDQFAADTRALTDVEPVKAGVPGFAGARCFRRTQGWEAVKGVESATVNQEYWHFKCIGRSDRYAFVAFSDEETDAKQQISAQYRILAGR